MQYRENPQNGDRLSILGFGCMRFPRDARETEREIVHAIERGVNYFDTAYIYPGSEETLGTLLEKNALRDKVFIATKLPPYFIKTLADCDRLLQTELSRLKTDHIDYYFLHMLSRLSDWERLAALGIEGWIADKKQQGVIRNIGFSYHGGREEFEKIIDAYSWNHCMIQYNYYDENAQAGKSGLHHAAAKNIPVMVMEPLRGGQLVRNLPAETRRVFDEAPGDYSYAARAFRWLWNQPEIVTVLSGMNSMEMLDENLAIAEASSPGMLSPEELALYDEVRESLRAAIRVPCTGCNYCMPCPAGVDIPLCFSSLNDLAMAGSRLMTEGYYAIRVGDHNASRCIQCGKCEKHCPQEIPIREKLREVAHDLEKFYYRPMKAIVRRFLRQNEVRNERG